MTLWNYKFRIFLRKSDVTLHHAAPRLSFCSVWHHSVGLNLFWRNWRIVSCHHLELCFYFFPGFIAHLDIDFFLVVPCLSALNDPNLYASLRMYTSYQISSWDQSSCVLFVSEMSIRFGLFFARCPAAYRRLTAMWHCLLSLSKANFTGKFMLRKRVPLRGSSSCLLAALRNASTWMIAQGTAMAEIYKQAQYQMTGQSPSIPLLKGAPFCHLLGPHWKSSVQWRFLVPASFLCRNH